MYIYMSKNFAFPIQKIPKPHENSSRTSSTVKILFLMKIFFDMNSLWSRISETEFAESKDTHTHTQSFY